MFRGFGEYEGLEFFMDWARMEGQEGRGGKTGVLAFWRFGVFDFFGWVYIAFLGYTWDRFTTVFAISYYYTTYNL